MKVRHIPSKRSLRKKKVAAYCRVSTGRYDQEESYETQRSYYEGYIMNNEEWEFAGIYADEKSGTKAENRPGFQALVRDALDGKVDMILVKSISRFSRNVVDCDKAVKMLASHGVSIVFEKERIVSTDPSSSMILSLMAAIAQDESRSISDNVKWANRQRVKRGEYNLGNNRVLGYDSIDGKPVPNKDAVIIRDIFSLFISGLNFNQIAEEIGRRGYKGLRGKNITSRGVAYILRNEIYAGDKLLQKNPPKNFLTKRPEKNKDYESNLLIDDHEPIVSREDWITVQRMLAEKCCINAPGVSNKVTRKHALYGKVFCAECEAPFVRKTALKNTDENGKRVYHKVWKCSDREKGKHGNGCRCDIIAEETLLKEICEQMGWTDECCDAFPFERLNEIEHIEIGRDGIAVYEY